MQNEILSVIMNGLMAGLLLATIVYCLRLNSRIRVLQDSRSELASIIREFDESTQRATNNINEIHAATMRISENMQHKIDKANYLANDLDALIDRGNKMTGKGDTSPARHAPQTRPEQHIAPQARSLADIMPARSSEAPAQAQVEPQADAGGRRPLRTRSRAEQELMNLMGNKNTDENR